jgi:hypothetical protein
MIRFSGLSFGMREMITISAATTTLIATTKTSKSRMIRSTADKASIGLSMRRAISESRSSLFNGLRRPVNHYAFSHNFKWLSYKR